MVDLAVGGIEVLRRLVVAHSPRAEPDHPPAGIGRGEHDPFAEAVEHLARTRARTLGQTGGQQLFLGEPGLARREQDAVPSARGIANAKLAQDLLTEAAAEQVLAGRLGLTGVPQIAGVVVGRTPEQLVQALAAFAPLGRAGILLLGLELDAAALGE